MKSVNGGKRMNGKYRLSFAVDFIDCDRLPTMEELKAVSVEFDGPNATVIERGVVTVEALPQGIKLPRIPVLAYKFAHMPLGKMTDREFSHGRKAYVKYLERVLQHVRGIHSPYWKAGK